MPPLPKRKAHEVFEGRGVIEKQLHDTFTLDEVSVARLEREARKLIAEPTTPSLEKAALYHEMAYFFALRGKFSEAIKSFDSSLELGLPELSVLFSKAHVCLLCGEISMARKVLEGIDLPSGDANAKDTYTGLGVQAGMYKDAERSDGTVNIGRYYASVASKIFSAAGLSDRGATERLDFAAKFLVGKIDHPILSYDIFAMEGEGVLFQFVVKKNTDELLSIEREMVAALSENFDDDLDSMFSIGLTPFVPGMCKDLMEAYHVSI